MKKLIAIFAVLLFAVPALAADWSFYGSERLSTFYTKQDFGDGYQSGTNEHSDWGLTWDFQGNSRIGAKVKADKVTGHIELALGQGSSNGGNGNNSNGGDGNVGTRRAYGVWKFADNASLKVGKDYSPVTNLVSGQVFQDDAGLLGQGDFYGKRPGQIGLQVGGFELAFITNALKEGTDITPARSDLDWNVPKIEARYSLKMDAFELIPFGGFQYFKVSDNDSALQDDLDVYSYVVGGVAKVNIGAFYVAAEGAWGQNWANANWADGRSTGRIAGFNAASASLNSGLDDVNDSTSWLAMVLAGLKFTDTLKFEAGVGYRSDDPDIQDVDPLTAWEAYLQAVITLAPGVNIIPEVGYIDYMKLKGDNFDNFDLGYAWYAGAKWQIDF